MTGFPESTYILYAAAAVLTPGATRQFGPEFGRENPLHLSFYAASEMTAAPMVHSARFETRDAGTGRWGISHTTDGAPAYEFL